MNSTTTDPAPPAIVRQIVDRLHVSASRLDVIRAVRQAMTREARADGGRRRWRHQVYRQALDHHRQNQALYGRVMSGRLPGSMECWTEEEQIEHQARQDLKAGRYPIEGY